MIAEPMASSGQKLIINFSEPFLVVEDLSQLTAKDYIFKGEKKSAIEIVIKKVEGQTDEEIKFTWEPVSYTENYLEL